MLRYVAVLRGITVGGKNIIKLAALSEALNALKFDNVVSYIQSGNIAFDGTKQSEVYLAEQISALILQVFGLTVPTIVLSQHAVKNIVKQNPYLAVVENQKSLHITFSSGTPIPNKVSALLSTMLTMWFASRAKVKVS
jgi:uncharacterized protein (DUF1697 family)